MKPEQEKVDAALVEKGSSPISSREEQFSIEYDEEQFEADTRTAIELSCERPRSVKEDAAFELEQHVAWPPCLLTKQARLAQRSTAY